MTATIEPQGTRVGRKALIALSPPPTHRDAGLAVGEVARLFDTWLTLRQATNRIASARTLAGYHDDMARWATLLAPPGEGPAWDRLRLKDPTVEAISAGLAAMSAAGLSVPARQRAMAPLRGLCSWLARNQHLSYDPTARDDLTIKGQPQRLPVAYSTSELTRIAQAVPAIHDDQTEALRWPAPDEATFALLAGCGLRISEVCSLTWDRLVDLDSDQPLLRVRGKGSRERTIPLPPTVTANLRAYRTERISRATQQRSPLAVRPRSRVIVQTDGRIVSATVVNHWIARWLRHASVARRPGALAHAFRHTAADGWLDNGATLAEVQALLGHASIATTGVYTKARPDTLAAVTRGGRYEQLGGRLPPLE
jgi:integrase/recombinase XerD